MTAAGIVVLAAAWLTACTEDIAVFGADASPDATQDAPSGDSEATDAPG